MTFDLWYYFAVFLRRLPYFILTFVTVLAAALTAAFLLPPRYESDARLLVESSQIPDELAAPTVNTAAREQLQIIEQRLMTRSNLLDIAKRFDVFQDISEMTPDDIVSAMRDNTDINTNSGRDEATSMIIRFEAETARTAAAVVNEYVTLILRDNVTIRTDRAQQTLEFFEQEVDRLAVELSTQSARILEFQNANAGALPDTLNFRMEQQSSQQERLSSVEAEITALNEQKQRLIQLYNSTGQVQDASPDTRTPAARQLDSLKEELNSALAIYSTENPRVKLLEARIAQLETVVAGQVPATSPETPAVTLSPLDIQTSEIDSRIAVQTRQRDQIAAELEVLKDSIARTATNAIALEALNRDYENIQGQYNTAVNRLSQASTGERIEVLSKGQRIAVLDAATIPSEPSKPKRTRIVAAGIVAGLGLGAGLVALLEMLNGAVRRPSDLVRHLDIHPIGAIPYVRTRGEALRRILIIVLLLLAVPAGLLGLIYAIHTYYLPLDLLLDKIANKVGL